MEWYKYGFFSERPAARTGGFTMSRKTFRFWSAHHNRSGLA